MGDISGIMAAELIVLAIGAVLLLVSVGAAKSVKVPGGGGVLFAPVASRRGRIFLGTMGVVLIVAGVSTLVYPQLANAGDQDHLISPEGEPGVAVYSGPSVVGYARTVALPAGTPVRLICTAYGLEVHGNPLWDYTDKGWVSDRYVDTHARGPAANACIGSVSVPKSGTGIPNRAVGPFAVVADEGREVPLRSQPSIEAQTVQSLAAGTFVVLSCHVTGGPSVPAPRGISSSNNDWDRIVTPSGWPANGSYWVSDSAVLSYRDRSSAPTCP